MNFSEVPVRIWLMEEVFYLSIEDVSVSNTKKVNNANNVGKKSFKLKC